MNKQEFIELARKGVAAIVEQGVKSENKKDDCAYLSENGNCCVVGHMMPDDETRKLADAQAETSINSLSIMGFKWLEQFTQYQIDVLIELQQVHDGAFEFEYQSKYAPEYNSVINKYEAGDKE